jgi:hypothetical protein
MLWMLPLVAALGFAMRFPAVVNAAPAGTNNAFNAMRGVFGIAALAADRARRSSACSPGPWSAVARRLATPGAGPPEAKYSPLTAAALRQHRSPTGSSPRHGSGGSRLFGLVAAALAPPTSTGKEEAER